MMVDAMLLMVVIRVAMVVVMVRVVMVVVMVEVMVGVVMVVIMVTLVMVVVIMVIVVKMGGGWYWWYYGTQFFTFSISKGNLKQDFFLTKILSNYKAVNIKLQALINYRL